jgi:acetoin utilization protein AcuC
MMKEKPPHSKLHSCCVYLGDKLAAYNFGKNHPFGPLRHQAFTQAFYQQALEQKVDILDPVSTDREVLALFHSEAYLDKLIEMSKFGVGNLDNGDTPAFSGMYETACYVAGSVLDAVDQLMSERYKRAFIPIAGLHHARRHTAAGFCVINDCGIAIEILLNKYGLNRVAYVDIDAHHADGVFYSFEDDPRLFFVDLHEDGKFLYPGTGAISEIGKGKAAGTKLNIPMPPYADDALFFKIWPTVEKFLNKHQPEFILFQCGADSLKGDPITQLAYSEKVHAYAARRLCEIADKYCGGKVLAMGGGGYNLDNIARAWTAVVNTLSE